SAIVGRRRPQDLLVDHFGEADDRVQRRANFMDELAQRFPAKRRAMETVARRFRPFVGARASSAAAKAEEAAGARIEAWNRRDPPVAGSAGIARYSQPRVTKWRAAPERSGSMAVDAMVPLTRFGDRQADELGARRPS